MSETTDQNEIKILLVFASPVGTDPLRLGAEDKIIKECISLSEFRDRIKYETLHAASIHDVRRALLRGEYQVVHFSGHGTGKGLVLEGPFEKPQLVPPEALAEVLWAYSPPIECVILNACYTADQGKLISFEVPYTIGMSSAITDSAATEFVRGFYDAIGAGKDFEFAFQEGCRTVKLTGVADVFEPVFHSKEPAGDVAEMKIVSEQHISFENEDEVGFLDCILDGMGHFERVTEILTTMSSEITELGNAVQEDALEIGDLSNRRGRSGLTAIRFVVNRSAGTMDNFARQLEAGIPEFRSSYSTGIDLFGKAASLLKTEFEQDNTAAIEGAVANAGELAESITMAQTGIFSLKQSIADLPKLTSRLTRAKYRCLKVLDSLTREFDIALGLTQDVQTLMKGLLDDGDRENGEAASDAD